MQQESNMDSYKNPVLQYSAWKSTTGSVSSYPITGHNYHCFPRIHIVPQEIHHAKRVREEVQLERERRVNRLTSVIFPGVDRSLESEISSGSLWTST